MDWYWSKAYLCFSPFRLNNVLNLNLKSERGFQFIDFSSSNANSNYSNTSTAHIPQCEIKEIWVVCVFMFEPNGSI